MTPDGNLWSFGSNKAVLPANSMTAYESRFKSTTHVTTADIASSWAS